MFRRTAAILVLLLIAAAVWLLPGQQADLFPASGKEHPFYQTMDEVLTDPAFYSGSDGASRPGIGTKFTEAARTVRVEISVLRNERRVPVTLEATRQVPEVALHYLSETLQLIPVDSGRRKDLAPFLEKPAALQEGMPEVRLPLISDQSGEYLVAWPDGWEMVRPYVIRLRADYFNMRAPADDDGEVGAATQALTGAWSGVDGILRCQAPDQPASEPLAFVEVTINGLSTHADASGAFSLDAGFTDVDALSVRYDGRIDPVGSASQGPRISVMNDFHNPRSETVDVVAGTTAGGRLNIGVLTLTSLDCELHNHGRTVLEEFHTITGNDPPAPDDLRIKRWEGVTVGTPYSYYDYVVISTGFRGWNGWEGRRRTIRHEFGHTIRHAADGDSGHWGWDNFRWVYARDHDGTEVFNEHYAFNEGFGRYWACTVTAAAPCPGAGGDVPGAGFRDWNEIRVAQYLFDLSRETGVGHANMIDLLVTNPGTIHTLIEFERRYCARFNISSLCSSGAPIRVRAACPRDFRDDGATCAQTNNIIPKPSYGRGGGEVPRSCGGRERDAGLCYDRCRPGFDGVGPVCWRRCPPGMIDDGAFCRRDVRIIASDNSACPWYDVCGIALERGCSTCPAGFQNDGCTCRIDAWIFAKASYGRGGGETPTDCGPGREYDGGLCYRQCRPEFNGVGPVCWGQCDAGYDDHGGTCYRPPNILVKF